MILDQLQKRIKGARIFEGEKGGIKRLYFPYGRRSRDIKTTAWFEVINDRLELGVKVENYRKSSMSDSELARQYRTDLLSQFHEIVNDCELERKKTPLIDRLKDDIVPVYGNDSLLHQVQGLRFMCSMKVSALFADTGTGKTKMAIDLAQSRFESGQITKVLVCCPVSTIQNFKDEIEKWKPGGEINWLVIGHESLSGSDRVYFESIRFVNSETLIIIDESHLCGNPLAKRSKRILNLCQKTSYKLIMTGTPTENVRDIYNQYAILSELIIGCRSWMHFENKYLIIGGLSGDEVLGHKNVNHLMGLLEPYTYQIRKEDCLQLPAKKEQTIECYMSDEQTELYEMTRMEMMEEIDRWEFPPAHTIFRYLTMLQQICCGFYKDRYRDVESISNPKIGLIPHTGYDQGQTIFFCKYLNEVEQLVGFLGKEQCAIFTGQNRTTRNDEKHLFTSGDKKYFVATMSSGGTGLNGLQGCNRIVFFSNSFKWRERKQCIGRIDRQGQTREMEIWDTVVRSGMEYRIRQNLRRKGDLADEIRELLHDKTKLKQYVNDLKDYGTAGQ